MKTDPPIEVWKFTNNSWTWLCWECGGEREIRYGTEHDTHAEALAAALAHCAKKETT